MSVSEPKAEAESPNLEPEAPDASLRLARWGMSVMLAVLVVGAAWVAACQPDPPELRDIGEVPEFTFVDQAGASFGSAQLKGRPYVANFLFTSCPTQCPPLARATAEVQAKIAGMAGSGEPPAQLISISVDPLTDTPERLAEFAGKYGADAKIWRLLRSPTYEAMEKLVVGGFYAPLQRNDIYKVKPDDYGSIKNSEPTPLDTAHSIQFVLVDRSGRIRALFQNNPEGLKDLEGALRYLIDHPDA